MENNTTRCCSKKFKLILTTIVSICLVSFIISIGVWIYHSPLVDVFTVEYVKGFNDVLVQKYYKGEKISFPEAPTKEGYEFVGWSLDKNSNSFLTSEIVVEQELILYAKWVKCENEKSVSFAIESDNPDGYHLFNLSHDENINVGEKLSFELRLNDDTNLSNVQISSSSGVVSIELKNDMYCVTVEDFCENFTIYIDNVITNIYTITYYNEDYCWQEEVEHGSALNLPILTKDGMSLMGFKDSEGRFYTEEYIVLSNLQLFAVWEERLCNIQFPRSCGAYVVKMNNEVFASSKNIQVEYGALVEFDILLSSAYNNSCVNVYAIAGDDIIQAKKNGSLFVFENVSSDMQIVIDNVKVNVYALNVDGVNYGEFSFGSWISVDDNVLIVKDVVSGKEIKINTLIVDTNFGGWSCGGNILVNSIIQDLIDEDNIVEIRGNYSKKIARINFVANGGVLNTANIIIVDGEDFALPIPTKDGYVFAGWFTKLVEVNTVVEESLSERFEEIIDFNMVLYAGWTR